MKNIINASITHSLSLYIYEYNNNNNNNNNKELWPFQENKLYY